MHCCIVYNCWAFLDAHCLFTNFWLSSLICLCSIYLYSCKAGVARIPSPSALVYLLSPKKCITSCGYFCCVNWGAHVQCVDTLGAEKEWADQRITPENKQIKNMWQKKGGWWKERIFFFMYSRLCNENALICVHQYSPDQQRAGWGRGNTVGDTNTFV